MYVSSRGVRFKHKSFTAIIKAPEFDATIFNATTRKYTSVPYSVWMKRYGSRGSRTMKPLDRAKKIVGFNTRVYRCPTRNRDMIKELWMTEELKLPEQLTTFMSNVMNVPQAKGLPLKIIVFRKGQVPLVEWEVVACKKAPVSDTQFAVPANFKKVESEMDLLMKDEESSGMADLLR